MKTTEDFSLYRYIVELRFMEKLNECRWWQFTKRRKAYQWREEKLREAATGFAHNVELERRRFKKQMDAIRDLGDIFAKINELKPGEIHAIDESRIRWLMMCSGEPRTLAEILEPAKEYFKITRIENFEKYAVEYVFEKLDKPFRN